MNRIYRMKLRINPKIEIRNPKEIQRPKFEQKHAKDTKTATAAALPSTPDPLARRSRTKAARHLGATKRSEGGLSLAQV
jgi:hypothetical protein